MWQVYALGIQHLPKAAILGTYGMLELSILGPWSYSKNLHFIGEKRKTQRGKLTCFSQLLQPFEIKARETSFLIPLISIKILVYLLSKYVCESPTRKTVRHQIHKKYQDTDPAVFSKINI